MAKLSGKQLNKMEKMMVTARAKAVKEVIREQRIQQEPGLFIESDWNSFQVFASRFRSANVKCSAG